MTNKKIVLKAGSKGALFLEEMQRRKKELEERMAKRMAKRIARRESKKYFAKFLPEEGEIKRIKGGMRAFDEKGILQHIAEDIQLELIPNLNKIYKKASLFLCSRDIQVGDIVNASYNSNCVNGEVVKSLDDMSVPHWQIKLKGDPEFAYWEKGCTYKVVGEISPNATWIKEGDKFTEGDINITEQCPHYGGKHMWKDCSCKSGFIKGVYIKCPTCGTFH